MPDYGKHIKWPVPPKVLSSWVAELKKAYNRYEFKHAKFKYWGTYKLYRCVFVCLKIIFD